MRANSKNKSKELPGTWMQATCASRNERAPPMPHETSMPRMSRALNLPADAQMLPANVSSAQSPDKLSNARAALTACATHVAYASHWAPAATKLEAALNVETLLRGPGLAHVMHVHAQVRLKCSVARVTSIALQTRLLPWSIVRAAVR